MSRIAPLLALLLWTAPAVAAPASPPEPVLVPAEQAAIEAAVADELQRSGVPSVSLAVVREGAVVFARAYGKASDLLPHADAAMPYQIASNSKQFLAALLLVLRDEGRLSLDDKVSRWAPEVRGAERITVRQLLAHESGLQDYWPQDYAIPAMASATTPEAIVRRWAMQPLDYAPGTRWQYSNTGYVVAGLIAERAGGAPLATLLEDRLFRPLGIHPLMIEATDGPAFPHGYERFALGPVHEVLPPAAGWLFAAGELSMTARELALWDVARINRTILPLADWQAQETPALLADGTNPGYGLGVAVHERKGRRVIEHGGESVGFLSQNSVWPDDRAAVVVLTNAGFGEVAASLTERIAAVILPPRAPTPAKTTPQARGDDDPAATEAALAQWQALASGQFDAARFTANGLAYFTNRAREDYHGSLAALGACSGFTALGPSRLRGGFVNRNYRAVCGGRSLVAVTYAEPGSGGRWEQFMIMPE